MRKSILIMLTLFLLTGCFSDSENDSKKTKVDSKVTEYYNIVLKQLSSDNIGIVSGERIESGSVCCDNQFVYDGEVSNNNFNYTAKLTNYIGEEDTFENTSSIVTPSDEYSFIFGYGIANIYDIPLENCKINGDSLICKENEVVNNKFYVDAYDSEFIFIFDEDMTLTSISISHFVATINYFDGSSINDEKATGTVDDDLLSLASSFLETRNYELFNDVDIQVIYNVSEGTETILY